MDLGKIINQRYIIEAGLFENIYIAVDKELGHKVIIKLGDNKNSINLKTIEYRLYLLLKKNNEIGFAQCYALERLLDGRYFLVLERLYKNLAQLFDMCNRSFSMKTILYIAIQAINRIETLHKNKDIKPENFMIGFPRMYNFKTIHLIDFGLAKEYRNSMTKEHICKSETKRVVGTITYMSCNSHFNCEISRRDDFESLAYVLLYFLKGQLPWSSAANGNIALLYPVEQCQKIGSLKQAFSSEELFENYPEEFADFLSYTKNLEFEEEPNYEMIRSKFVDLFFKLKLKDDGIFDWE